MNKKEKMNMHHDIVVVGGGPAAITLAKILGPKRDIAVIRPENASMIYCAMPYVLEGLLPLESTLKKDALVTDAGAKLIRDTVTSIDRKAKSLKTQSGATITYSQLVLATGAEPILPPLEGSELSGVMTFKTEEDLTKLSQLLSEGLTGAVVVGAGAIGIELSGALKHRGIPVTLIDMAESILSNLIDERFSTPAKEQIETLGIDLQLGRKVATLGGSQRVDTVYLDDGTTVSLGPKGLVVFAVGMKPSVSLAEEAGLEIGPQGIVVSDRLETSDESIYAVGDCAQFVSGITGNLTPGKLATNAVPMARVLAACLSGEDRRYKGFYNGAATKVGELFVGGTGLTEQSALNQGFSVLIGSSRLTTQFPIMPGAKVLEYRLLFDAKSTRLIGAQVTSGEPVTSTIDLLTLSIQKCLSIEDLLDLSYSSQPYQSFFPAANGIVMAAMEAYRMKREAMN